MATPYFIRMYGEKELFRSYYIINANSIRGPEMPMVKKTNDCFFSNTLWSEQALSKKQEKRLTFRFYEENHRENKYWDFENELIVDELDPANKRLFLKPLAQFYKLESMQFVGKYHPFYVDKKTKKMKLLAYLLSEHAGLTHRIAQLKQDEIELSPVLYMPIDLKAEFATIKAQNIPFLGQLSLTS